MVTLTRHQQEQMDKIIRAGNGGAREMTLTGPAGTGKTTLVSKLGLEAVRHGPWRDVIYWTTTGRAMVVLRSKLNADVRTVHSGLYGRGLEERVQATAPDGTPLWKGEKPLMIRTGRLFFGEPQAPCEPGTLIVIDEASMVPENPIHTDLMSVLPSGCSVLYVGDKAQLPPPVGKQAPDFDDPTAELVEIHRQAWDNPVIRYATAIRTGDRPVIDPKDDRIRKWRYDENQAADWRAKAFYYDKNVTLVTGTNATRRRVNKRIRHVLAMDDAIELGELLCCFRNDHQRGIMNGETFTVSNVTELQLPNGWWILVIVREGDPRPILIQHGTIGMTPLSWSSFKDELQEAFLRSEPQGAQSIEAIRNHLISEGWTTPALLLPADLTHSQANKWMREAFLYVDYGYCLTIHKSQGSEWDEVGALFCNWVLNHPEAGFSRKARYTAVTRTRDKLRIWSP